MGYVTALLATVVRLFRPSQATHSAPYGRVVGVLSELRRRRSTRVRRYVTDVPVVAEVVPPLIPSPRRPIDDVPRALPRLQPFPVVDTREVAEPAALIRGYYLDFERRRDQHRVDRDRLDLAVLADIATPANHGSVTA